MLDCCLGVLEDAHERNEVKVDAALEARVRPHVPNVMSGMSIASAIDNVLRAQERYLGCDEGDGTASERALVPARSYAATPVACFDEHDARHITERIRQATNEVCMLLMDAHRGRAWVALGYDSWEHYVQHEFSLSRSRSYELLDQARVIITIREGARLPEPPQLSAYAAGQIKGHLPEVIAGIRARVSLVPGESLAEVVDEVIRDIRASLRCRDKRTLPPRRGAREDADQELGRLISAVEYLAHLPPSEAPAMAGKLSTHATRPLPGLERAAQWLAEFARHYTRVPRAQVRNSGQRPAGR